MCSNHQEIHSLYLLDCIKNLHKGTQPCTHSAGRQNTHAQHELIQPIQQARMWKLNLATLCLRMALHKVWGARRCRMSSMRRRWGEKNKAQRWGSVMCNECQHTVSFSQSLWIEYRRITEEKYTTDMSMRENGRGRWHDYLLSALHPQTTPIPAWLYDPRGGREREGGWWRWWWWGR